MLRCDGSKRGKLRLDIPAIEFRWLAIWRTSSAAGAANGAGRARLFAEGEASSPVAQDGTLCALWLAGNPVWRGRHQPRCDVAGRGAARGGCGDGG